MDISSVTGAMRVRMPRCKLKWEIPVIGTKKTLTYVALVVVFATTTGYIFGLMSLSHKPLGTGNVVR